MRRVFGVETEYGLAGRRGGVRLGSSDAATMLFRPLVEEYRASNVFLGNGGRLYLDVGAHPEYATPECLTPLDAVVAARAGDDLVAGLAERATELAREDGVDLGLRLFKNNTDAHGNSYGSHENYLISRELDPELVADLLASFLVTRQVLCGSGRLVRGRFLISQRADHLHASYAATTTRARPLVNSRDEPLADPSRFRRLHVLAGDSNLSEPSAWLRLASTELVLRLIEDAGTDALVRLRLAEPMDALPRVARSADAVLTLADGSTIGALDLQQEFVGLVEPLPGEEPVRDAWVRVLDALRAGDPDSVADTVEWAAKRRLLAEFRERHGLEATAPRLAALDLAFHELGTSSVFSRLERAGVVARLSTDEQVAAALAEPPSGTRAAVRGRLVQAARRAGADYSVDWTRLTAHPGDSTGAGERTLLLADPLDADTGPADEFITSLGW